MRILPARQLGETDARVNPYVASNRRESLSQLVDTMKLAAGALKNEDIPHLLAGGLAAWARGGPETDHDVDFFVYERDAERALAALADVGMRPEKPSSGWLMKAYDGDVLVDLIYRPAGCPVDAAMFERADVLEVMAEPLLVSSLDDVLSTKLMAMTEQEPDYRAVLTLARSLREQIDWDHVYARTSSSPFARAFFVLTDGLGILGGDWPRRNGQAGGGSRPLVSSRKLL
jgi:hypothetical protein